jgi:predicted SAM-dependent methyltransferase
MAVRRAVGSRRNFDWVRFEAQCAYQRLANALSLGHRRAVRELSQRRGISLNLGTGGEGRSGWVNVDAFPHADNSLTLDIRRRLPFLDGQVRRIFASHVIEHLDFRDELPRVLSELHRVLQPGGVVRIIVPDVPRYLEAYLSGEPARWNALGWDLGDMPDDIYTPMHILNHVFHQGGEHKFGFDFETMELVLRRAGFGEVVRQCHGRSLDPALVLDLECHARYSLYVDARR